MFKPHFYLEVIQIKKMLSPEVGQYMVIGAIAMAIFFVVALFAIIVYWMRRIIKRRSDKNKRANVEMDVEVNGHKQSENEGSDNEISLENEGTEDYEDIMASAISSGINLIVYSCMPESKPFKVLLCQSKQLESEPRIGVFNQGKKIKKETLFGPYQSEKEFFLIQIRQKRKYMKGIKKLTEANNWLGFINKATFEDINVKIIKRIDDGAYFYEATRDIRTGEEMLAKCSWLENDKK